MSSPSISGPPPPRTRQTPAKPRITINIPPQHAARAANSPYLSTGPHTAHSNSTVAPGGPPQWPLYENPFTGANMYKQFEGFCDFTMASAKSGLGFGPHQDKGSIDFMEAKINLSEKLFVLARSGYANNLTHWQQEVEKQLNPFLGTVRELYEQGKADLSGVSKTDRWDNTWSAMFYCGTVFTTIANEKFDDMDDIQCHRHKETRSQKDESSESSRSSPHHFDRDNGYTNRKVEMQNNQKEFESKELSKLEINLRRFEEERCRFELEKRKFDREKREMDRIRYRRLEDFERKRQERKKEESKQPDEHIQHYRVFDTGNDVHRPRHDPVTDKMHGKLSPILKKPRHLIPPSKPIAEQESSARTLSPLKISNPIRDVIAPILQNFESSPPNTPVCDDYESSTAMSSSSREGDFDDIDFSKLPVVEDNKSQNHSSKNDIPPTENPSKLSWLSRLFRKKQPSRQPQALVKSAPDPIKELQSIDDNMSTVSLLKFFLIESRVVWRQLLSDHAVEWEETKLLRNKCIADLIVLTIFCGMGGMIFRFVEGAFENFYKCGVRRVKRDFVDNLWTTSHNLREDEWKQAARNKLRKFEEELHSAHEAGMTSYSGLKAWTFINGIIYCITVVTTIGYGNLTPKTKTGKTITIIYAIIGIPMFLILLADFGKLFTRGIKFMWAYVRRLYYTGSCRKVRKQAQVQDVLRGMNMAYEIATFRRPSMMMKGPDVEEGKDGPSLSQLTPPSNQESPTTPMPPDVDDIDDEFNLPISLAFFLLLAYILCGAAVYTIWEEWTFFEACYFVFISISTIGFGDNVPKHPALMMMSILYLIFGLALTSMCINVVQVKLSDSFRHATAKIGATIGLSLAEEEALSQTGTPTDDKDDTPSVHSSSLKLNNPTVVIDEPPPLLPKKSETLSTNNDKSKKKSKK